MLNTLLNEERAIVSSIAGTTRDTIEDQININGVNCRFIDTAGIRNTDDEIESIGIERTFKKMSESEIIIFLIDYSTLNHEKLNYFYDLLLHDLDIVVSSYQNFQYQLFFLCPCTP